MLFLESKHLSNDAGNINMWVFTVEVQLIWLNVWYNPVLMIIMDIMLFLVTVYDF